MVDEVEEAGVVERMQGMIYLLGTMRKRQEKVKQKLQERAVEAGMQNVE